MKVKEESEKVGLKLNIQKTKIMAFGPITSWQIDGETVETVSDFILGGSKITSDGDCSHEIKRCLLLGRKVMANLYSILKSRDVTFPTKVHLFKAMVFPLVMYGCESWTVKKAERWKIDAFELCCCRKLLRGPWLQSDPTSPSWRRSVLGVHWRDWFWSWNSNTLAIWCKELTHWKRPRCWEGLEAGGGGDDRGWDGWMASLTLWTWVWVNSGVGDGQGGVVSAIHGITKHLTHSDTTQWLNWTELRVLSMGQTTVSLSISLDELKLDTDMSLVY